MPDEIDSFFSKAEVVTEAPLAEHFDDADKNRAIQLGASIEKSLASIASGYAAMQGGYTRLGIALLEVRTKKFWSLWGYASFGGYIDTIKDQANKGRTQLYNAITVAQHLMSAGVSEPMLDKIGITCGNVLAGHVRRTGKLESGLLQKALSGASIEEIKAATFEAENIPAGHQMEMPGRYIDLGGFYATEDERQEIERAFDCAVRTDPVIGNNVKEWQRKKEIMLRLSREYLATYEKIMQDGACATARG